MDDSQLVSSIIDDWRILLYVASKCFRCYSNGEENIVREHGGCTRLKVRRAKKDTFLQDNKSFMQFLVLSIKLLTPAMFRSELENPSSLIHESSSTGFDHAAVQRTTPNSLRDCLNVFWSSC